MCVKTKSLSFWLQQESCSKAFVYLESSLVLSAENPAFFLFIYLHRVRKLLYLMAMNRFKQFKLLNKANKDI